MSDEHGNGGILAPDVVAAADAAALAEAGESASEGTGRRPVHGLPGTYVNHGCRCPVCRGGWRGYKATAKAERKRLGMCLDCPEAAVPERRRCAECLTRYNARAQQRREWRAEALQRETPHRPTIKVFKVTLPKRAKGGRPAEPGGVYEVRDTGLPSIPPEGVRRRRKRADMVYRQPDGSWSQTRVPHSSLGAPFPARGWTPPPDAAPGVNQPFYEGPPPLMHADGAAEVGDDMLKALQARDYFNEEPTARTHTPSEADPTSPDFLPIGPNGKRVTKEGYAKFKQRIADGQAELARRAAAEEAAEKDAKGGAAADAGTGDEKEG